MFNILSPLIRLLHCFTKECHSRESGNPLILSIGKLLLYVNQNMIARCGQGAQPGYSHHPKVGFEQRSNLLRRVGNVSDF